MSPKVITEKTDTVAGWTFVYSVPYSAEMKASKLTGAEVRIYDTGTSEDDIQLIY